MFQKYSFPLCIMNLTKANNAREETIASEYRNFVKHSLNKELPDALKINFLHYDVKSKKKKVKNFPHDLLEHLKTFLEKTKFFSCFPCVRMPYDPKSKNRKDKRHLCNLQIQRGIIRTNCIDSLDRTNFGQEMIGYRVALMQLKKLGLSDNEHINMNSDLFRSITIMYDEMGDQISMQYGGSIAHHA